MKKLTLETNFKYDGHMLPINTWNGRYGCYVEILNAIACQLFAMRDRHSALLVFVFDLHLNEHTSNNQVVSSYIKTARRKLFALYNTNHLGYSWVREHNIAKAQHYHIGFMLDGNKIQHPGKALHILEQIWKPSGGFNKPDNCFYHFTRNDLETLYEAYFRLSYQAKERNKGKRPPTTNDYSSSRLKRFSIGQGTL